MTNAASSLKQLVRLEINALVFQLATVRLAPVLPTTVAVCGFPSVERAVSASGEIINKGVPIRESDSPGAASPFIAESPLYVPQNASNCVIAP